MNLNKIIAGDTLDFSTNVVSYPPSAGWTLKYRLVPRVSGAVILIVTAADVATDFHRAQIAPSVTAIYAAMDYSWSSWVEKVGARYTVNSGSVTVLPDPASVAFVDNRTLAQKNLDACNLALSNFLLSGNLMNLEVQIGERKRVFRNAADLEIFIDLLKREVAMEVNAARIAAGLGTKNTIRMRG